MSIGYLDLRHQVQDPHLDIDAPQPRHLTSVRPTFSARFGLAVGDRVETINGAPYTGRAQLQADRWYARPGENLRISIAKPDGTRAQRLRSRLLVLTTPFISVRRFWSSASSWMIPLVCLLAGYWVAPRAARRSQRVARSDHSQFSRSVSFGLDLQLAARRVAAPAPVLAHGVANSGGSRTALVRSAVFRKIANRYSFAVAEVARRESYSPAPSRVWRATTRSGITSGLLPHEREIDALTDATLNWLIVACIVIYGVAIFDKLRHGASTADVRRRLRGAVCRVDGRTRQRAIRLGRIAEDGCRRRQQQEWLQYLSAMLMLAFPFSLAYVILVQRAMDVSILLRIGTRYILQPAPPLSWFSLP